RLAGGLNRLTLVSCGDLRPPMSELEWLPSEKKRCGDPEAVHTPAGREKGMRTWLRASAFVVAVVLGCFVGRPAGAVPNPTVTGRIAAHAPPGDPSHDYPFFSFAPQLAALKGPHDYVEEEFFFEGTANRYTIPTGVSPNSATGAILDSEHPYKTRMIVRRPNRLRDFNGTVFVEWLNVTAGYRHAE